MCSIMKVASAFAIVLLSISTQHKVDAAFPMISAITNQVNRIKEETVEVQTLLTSAVTDVLDNSRKFVGESGRTFNSTLNDLGDQLKKLRQNFPSSEYDVCFPHTYIFKGAKHTTDGVVRCVDKAVQVATKNAQIILAETSEIIKSLDEISGQLEVCNVLSFSCIRLVTGILQKVANIAKSALTIGASAGELVAYFATIRYTFAPCVVKEAKYLSMATDFVNSAVNCVGKITG